MNRIAALILALALTGIAVPSTALASAAEPLEFTLAQHSGASDIQANFYRARNRHDHSWTSNFAASQLAGLDLAAFRSNGPAPIRFAMIRDSGRLDCAGQGGRSAASGGCAFRPDPAFARALAVRGIRAPDEDGWFGLLALDVRLSLVEALADAHYPVPSIDDLVSMTAVGVTGAYVQSLAQAGYRPASLESLVEFKAVGVTPEWIGGLVRAG